MESSALIEARARGAEVYPLLCVDWNARGLSLGRGLYSPAIRRTDLGPVTQITKPGGWGEIVYGSGIEHGTLEVATAEVSIADPDGSLAQLIETYEPLGSPARIDWAADGLVSADYEPIFRGIVQDRARDGLYTKLIMKTDDAALRKPIPGGSYLASEWGAAADSTIFGTQMPLVLGVHDSWQVTARGSVPLVNIRYDKDLGYWWLVSVGRMVSIDRVYFDGVPQGDSSTGAWTVLSGVYGGNLMTIVSFAEGAQPGKDAIVACDCHGPNENGLASGDALTGAPDILRAILQEWAWRDAPLAQWRGATAMVDATSWDAASAFFALHKIEAARRLGADQTAESAAEVAQTFLDSYLWVRMWWTPLGALAMGALDPDDVDPVDGDHIELDLHQQDVVLEPGDLKEVYTQLKEQYLWSPCEQKFMAAYEAHDIAALSEKVQLALDNPWTQGRFTRSGGVLNPASPADPTP